MGRRTSQRPLLPIRHGEGRQLVEGQKILPIGIRHGEGRQLVEGHTALFHPVQAEIGAQASSRPAPVPKYAGEEGSVRHGQHFGVAAESLRFLVRKDQDHVVEVLERPGEVVEVVHLGS